jgi:S-adenosylmethionine decarboxylase proenzyme
MKTHGPFASQMLIELHGCKAAVLNDPAALKDLLLEAVRRGHGTIVTDVFHTFSPHGVSGVIVIAESHVAIHTWPEHGYAAVDIFSCGTKLDHAAIRDWIATGMGASNVEFQELTRG